MQASKRAFFSRGGAACAAAAILIGSSLTASAAYAAPSTALAPAPITAEVQSSAATDVESLFAAYVAEYGVQKLEAVTVDAAGNFTIRTGEPAAAAPATSSAQSRSAAPETKQTDEEFKATVGGNVTIDRENVAGPAAAFATDVTNGQGYTLDNNNYTCSIGWNGFSAAGDPAVITAGHCANDGAATKTELTDSEEEVTAGGPGFITTGPLGTFGFSQFGGPGNSRATNVDTPNPGNIGTDIAVIDGIDTELNQLAKVTDWTTPADPKASGPKVTGVSEAIPGAKICKSGRTTGWSCGTVEAKAIFLVGGGSGEADDVRAVRGFSSKNLKSAPGDSGGAIISDTTAVGMISAGSKDGKVVYGVSIKDALAATDGYTVKIFLNAPKVTTTAPVYRKGAITGSVAGAPAGTKVAVKIDGTTTEVAVDSEGKWTAAAPNKFGTFDVTAATKNGYSTSETTEASIEVIKETLAVPAITAPAQDSEVAAPVTTITGTGKAGATIELTGDVSGNAEVGTDGTWSFTVSPALKVGNYAVTAKQTLDNWNDSKTVTNKFNVLPAAPAVTSPTDGQKFAYDQGPSVLSGTNIAGATVSVDINGVQLKATVSGTTWNVSLGEKLRTGQYSVSVVQSVDGIDSLPGTSAFSVSEAPAPAPTTEPAPVVPAPTTDPAPSATPAPAPNENDLANTGVSNPVMLLGAAGGVLMIGGIAFLLFRRRNSMN
ncbi:LPXTG cell wall anchor domain-containing protein [Arthrobacter sp. TMP15]|uniref:LPXTG cell wall anchor domain-containing protein n=1 Tax=Arthrobacter sp. TMP15 TaxID=3140789 RepID=UPI0031BB53FC